MCIHMGVYINVGPHTNVRVRVGWYISMYINVYPYLNVARVLPNESVRDVWASKKNQRRSMMSNAKHAPRKKFKKTT